MKNNKRFLPVALVFIAASSAMAQAAGPLDDAATTLTGFGTPVTAALTAAAGILALFVAYKFLRKIFGA